ncbi:MAG: FitA-like ribbon-helix-helix domain-containing protein [Solirubrobacterales bacterium]
MPKTIQIRNVPEGVHRELRTRAAAAGMSLSEFALAQLARVAERPPLSDVLARATTRDWGVDSRDNVAIVRAMRDGLDR